MENALNNWQIQPGVLSDGANQLRFLRVGHGKKVIIAFHGFGEDATRFVPLGKLLAEDYTMITFDFPGNSADLWKGKNKPDCKIISQFIHRICAEFKVEKITLMGFSMGARPALCLTGYLSEKVEKLVLLAPDGLSKNIWYYLATHNFYGRLLFRQVVRKPEKIARYRQKLVKLRLVHKPAAKIAQTNLKTQSNRERVLIDWTFTRNFIPNQRFILSKIRKKSIPLLLFMGAKDVIFPVELGRQFIQGLPSAALHVLNCGHQILNSDNLQFIASLL